MPVCRGGQGAVQREQTGFGGDGGGQLDVGRGQVAQSEAVAVACGVVRDPVGKVRGDGGQSVTPAEEG